MPRENKGQLTFFFHKQYYSVLEQKHYSTESAHFICKCQRWRLCFSNQNSLLIFDKLLLEEQREEVGTGLQLRATQPGGAIKASAAPSAADVRRTLAAVSDAAVFGLQISGALHFAKLACLLPALATPRLFAYQALSPHSPPRLCLKFSGTICVHGATAALRHFQLSPVIISHTASLQHVETPKSEKRFQ